MPGPPGIMPWLAMGGCVGRERAARGRGVGEGEARGRGDLQHGQHVLWDGQQGPLQPQAHVPVHDKPRAQRTFDAEGKKRGDVEMGGVSGGKKGMSPSPTGGPLPCSHRECERR